MQEGEEMSQSHMRTATDIRPTAWRWPEGGVGLGGGSWAGGGERGWGGWGTSVIVPIIQKRSNKKIGDCLQRVTMYF